MKKLLWLLPLALVVGAVAWLMAWRSAPPKVPVLQVTRGTLVDVLSTNGKIEPAAWTAIRADRAGKLVQLYVQRGQQVAAGALIARLESRDLASALDAAKAKLQQVEAERLTLAQGGRATELAEITDSVRRLQQQRDTAQKELAIAERLVAKQAAPAMEVRQWKVQLEQVATQLQGLEQRRAALVGPADRALLDAKLAEARSGVQAAQNGLSQATISTPIAGVVYQLDPKVGAFLNPGDLIANVGRVDQLQVNVFVDEPELGRVAVGMPVEITWDAFPAKKWQGRVERMPLQIQALGSRQVGEVLVNIPSAEGELPPGANINAAIRSRAVEGALLLPKECLRRENGVSGVYVVAGGKLVWRPVELGATNVTQAQIRSGLEPGDVVVLATDVPLKAGMPVEPEASPKP